MAKTVFGSHANTAHVWAQGRGGDLGHGRSGDQRMFFEGRILYSYGRHFALGLVITAPHGDVAMTLLNSSKYSPSTGKHQSYTSRAARGRNVYVPDLTSIARALERVTTPLQPGETGLGRLRKSHMPEIERHIAANWAAFDDESAALVLGLVGGTAKQAAAIRAKAKRAAEAKALAEAKAHTAGLLKEAAQWAAMAKPAFVAHVRAVLGGVQAYYAESTATRLLGNLRAAHRAASKAGKVKHKAAVWAHIKTLQAFPVVAAARIEQRNGPRKIAAKVIRQYIANLNAPAPVALNERQWGQVWDAAGVVAKAAPNGSLLEGKALDLVDHANAQRDIARAEAERLAALKADEAKAEWIAGNVHSRWQGTTPNRGVYLRAIGVEIDGLGNITGTLQTSRGADVPLAHALKAFRFLKLCRAKGQAWQANGRTVPVGHFRIDRIATNGDFHAGCHFIEWEQVNALALRLGVDGWAGDESAVVIKAHA